jgi:hypothetical protein
VSNVFVGGLLADAVVVLFQLFVVVGLTAATLFALAAVLAILKMIVEVVRG